MRQLFLPFAWTAGAIAVAGCGFMPNPYLEEVRLIPPPHPYPVKGVVVTVGLMAAQVLLLHLVLRPASYRRGWARALVALIASCGFLGAAGLAAMHSPPYFGAYMIWVALLTVGMAALSFWSGFSAIRHTG